MCAEAREGGMNCTDQGIDRRIDQSTCRLTDLVRTTTDDRPSARATVQNTNPDATHACTHSQGTRRQATYIYIQTPIFKLHTSCKIRMLFD